MKTTNRVRNFTRWPDDPKKVIKLAELDAAFVAAILRCGYERWQAPMLNKIELVAGQQRAKAEKAMKRKGP